MTHTRRGATLIELVIALVITGFMAAAGSAALGAIVDHRRVILESTVEMERAAALRETLRNWIVSGTVQIQSGGVPRGGRGGGAALTTASLNSSSASSGGAAVSAAASTGDELTVMTTAPTPLMAPLVRVRIFVDGDDATPEQGLTVEYQAFGTGTPGPLQRVQLDTAVAILHVEFLDQRTARWIKASEGATTTITAVRLWLQPSDTGTLAGILQVPMVFRIGANQ